MKKNRSGFIVANAGPSRLLSVNLNMPISSAMKATGTSAVHASAVRRAAANARVSNQSATRIASPGISSAT